MRPVLALSVFVLLVCGCENRPEPAEDSTPAEATTLPADRAPVEPEEPEATQDPSQDLEATQEAAEELAKPPRDLAAELQSAVGSPLDCLQDYQPGAATVIRVGISAIVRPSGLIIEPSANGRGLSANDRRCIEQRVGDVVLRALDTQTSQPVSTYIDLNYQPPAVAEDDVGVPTPKLKDVVEPLPKKETIAPSGVPIDKAPSDPIGGPHGVPIEGSKGVPIEGPRPKPIDGYEETKPDSERWTD
jgi:hypothetical protein